MEALLAQLPALMLSPLGTHTNADTRTRMNRCRRQTRMRQTRALAMERRHLIPTNRRHLIRMDASNTPNR